jgi:hypothetical protein
MTRKQLLHCRKLHQLLKTQHHDIIYQSIGIHVLFVGSIRLPLIKLFDGRGGLFVGVDQSNCLLIESTVHRLTTYLQQIGFAPLIQDHSVFVNKSNTFIDVYVDDLLLFGPDGTDINQTKSALNTEF